MNVGDWIVIAISLCGFLFTASTVLISQGRQGGEMRTELRVMRDMLRNHIATTQASTERLEVDNRTCGRERAVLAAQSQNMRDRLQRIEELLVTMRNGPPS